MFKPLISSVFVSIMALCSLSAQQVYQSQDYGGPGTQQLYSRHIVGFVNDDINASGTNITWDVSALEASDLILSEIVTRDEGIDAFTFTALCTFGGIDVFTCLGIWSNTQQAWLIQDTQSLIQFSISDLRRFQRKTPSQLLETFFGFSLDLGGTLTPVAIVYQKPDTVLNFPLTYGDSLTSQISWGIDLAATGQNLQYASEQFRTSEVDGWGTLITPYDTLEGVLRVRAVIARNDILTSDSLVVPIMLNQLEYTWYDTAYGIPVMIATGLLTDTSEIINVVTYLVESECPSPTWSATTASPTYYLDVSGNALVEFNLEMPNAGNYAWNFDDGIIENSPGEISHVFTSAGTYEVVVTGCMTNCLPLNSCLSQTLVIEVIDTTSSVSMPDPELAGIRMYPIPVQYTLTIAVTKDNAELEFNILDIHGRSLHSGILQSGINQLDLHELTDGLYSVQFYDRLNGETYRAKRILMMK